MSFLEEALAVCIEDSLLSSSDQFVRIDSRARLPLVPALVRVKQQVGALLIGILDSEYQLQFENSGLDVTDDAHLLTQLRNRSYGDRGTSVVLIGSASGQSQSGLRQLHAIISTESISDMLSQYLCRAIEANHVGEDRRIRLELVKALTSLVRQRKLTLHSVDQYVESALNASDGSMRHLHENLWRLNLCPDEAFVSSASLSDRIDFNWGILETLKADFDVSGPKSRKLASSSHAAVQAFVRWLETDSDDDLMLAELGEVLNALRGGTKPPTRHIPTLLEVLADRDVQDRPAVLAAVEAELSDDDLVEDRIDAQLRAPTDVRLRIKGNSTENDPWTVFSIGEEGETLGAGQVVSVIRIRDAEGRFHNTEIREIALRRMLGEVVERQVLDNFFDARRALLVHFSILSSDSDHCLSLLVASSIVRTRSGEYVEAWKCLLRDFLESSDSSARDDIGFHLGLIDGIWTRDLEATEDIQDPVTHRDNKFDSVRLLPIHPWRLGPLFELAHEILGRFEDEPTFVNSTVWALDRAIPTFRVLQIGRNTLEYSTVVSGFVEFDETVDNALPPISAPGSLLGRAIRSYAKTYPWSRSGASVAVFNAPSGGILGRLSGQMSEDRGFGHDPALVVVRDKSTKGLDRESAPPGVVIAYDVPDARNWLSQNAFDRDLTLYFMPGMRGKAAELGLGAHGTIDLILASRGFDANGRALSVPQLKLAPAEDNEVVSLLHSVSGIDEVKSAVFNLTLPPTVQDVLPFAASDTSWLIVGAPAFISSFALQNSAGSPLTQIAEFDEGAYRFFVFTSSIEPLGEAVRATVEGLPIATARLERIKEIVNGLTATNPQKVFDIALNRFGSEEALGLMCARAIAQRYLKPNSVTIEISLDNVSWTHQWFEEEKRRADLILVTVATEPDLENPVEILVVEAKAVSASEFERPRSDLEPFTEAIQQVEATRGLLQGLFARSGEGLVESLQLRTLIEQVAAKAGSQYLSDERDGRDAVYSRVFDHISQLSRSDGPVPRIRTLVCTTYLGGVQNAQILEDDDLTLASASSKLLEEVLGSGEMSEPEVRIVGDVENNLMTDGTKDSGSGSNGPVAPSSNVAATSTSTNDGMTSMDNIDALVDNLSRALRLRSESVLRAGESTTAIGPTFLSVSFPFERGAQIAPLQRAEGDIARDLGVSSVEISNSSEMGRIQVLVPRPDRQFPALALGGSKAVGESRYLPFQIGQNLLGEVHESHLSSWPHALVAGTTGSGKTTFMRSLLAQLNDWGSGIAQAVIVDGKGETDYFGVLSSNMFVPEYPEPLLEVNHAVDVLTWLKDVEVPRRKELIREIARERQSRVDAKSVYIDAINSGETPSIKPLVVLIDEFNEIMIRGGQGKTAFVDGVTSVAQAARSVLVHLVLATQRPDRTVVPGTIKANLPVRIAFRLPTAADSVTVLGHGGAEKLLGLGDMLFQLNGEEDRRLQSFIFD